MGPRGHTFVFAPTLTRQLPEHPGAETAPLLTIVQRVSGHSLHLLASPAAFDSIQIHMKTVIEVEHLRKTCGQTVAVAGVSFSVAEGEIFGFPGPNGAGKTTTVECLQALREPDSGKMRVLGLDPRTEARQPATTPEAPVSIPRRPWCG